MTREGSSTRDPTEEAGEPSSVGDAVILGTLEGEHEALLSDAPGDFLTAATGEVERILAPAPVYIDQKLAGMLKDDAVLAFTTRVRREDAQLSVFEQHVVQYLDGQRPVARVRAMTGLSSDDLRIALAMMIDKKLLEQAGVAKRRSRRAGSGPPPTAAAPAPAAAAPAAPTRPAPSPREASPPPARDPKKVRARELYEQALKDFEVYQRARGLLFAKMAASTDPDEPMYQALVDQWAHLDSVPAKKVVEPEWVRLMSQAQAAEDRADHDGAIALLESALRGRPDQGAIHNRLGVILATRKKQYQRAAEHLIRAVELEPGNATFTNNLGKVLGLADDAGAAGKVKLVVAKLSKRRF